MGFLNEGIYRRACRIQSGTLITLALSPCMWKVGIRNSKAQDFIMIFISLSLFLQLNKIASEGAFFFASMRCETSRLFHGLRFTL